MRSSKLMKLIRKAMPYILVAVVAYLIYTAHTNEGFEAASGGGGNSGCTLGKLATCTSTYTLSGSRCVKDASGGKIEVGPPPTCECPSGMTVKCPTNKLSVHSDGKCYTNATTQAGGEEKRCR